MASKEFSNTLKNLRIKAGYTQKQVYEHFNIPQSTFSSWEVGKSEPSGDMLIKLCEFYKCDMMKEFTNPENVLFTSNELKMLEKYRKLDDIGRQHVDTVLSWETERIFYQTIHIENEEREDEVPVYILNYYQCLASAGSGEYLFDNIPTDTIEVPANNLSEQADFVIGVNGHSMEPTYKDGDKVYVEISAEIPIGSIGIFTMGSDCFIKELGQDRLISHNHDKKNYPDIPASEDIRCVGLVLGKVEED